VHKNTNYEADRFECLWIQIIIFLAEYLKIMGTLHKVKQVHKVGEAMTFTGAKVP
jgi:hypothetical protein